MSQPSYNILIATLLMWYDLDLELSREEKLKFQDIGLQLYTDPTQWESTEEELLAVIAKNPKLTQLFQYYKSCLEQRPDHSLLSLIPQGTALDLVAPSLPKNNYKGVLPHSNNSGGKSNEITNTFIRIALSSDPSASIKKVEDIEKLKQSVQSNNPNT